MAKVSDYYDVNLSTTTGDEKALIVDISGPVFLDLEVTFKVIRDVAGERLLAATADDINKVYIRINGVSKEINPEDLKI